MYTINITEWVASRLGNEVTELPNLSIESQLDKYDAAGTGIGFVLVLAATTADVDDDEVPQDDTQKPFLSLASVPIIKLKNEWRTITDENISDIASGLIRLIASGESNGTDPSE